MRYSKLPALATLVGVPQFGFRSYVGQPGSKGTDLGTRRLAGDLIFESSDLIFQSWYLRREGGRDSRGGGRRESRCASGSVQRGV